MQVTRIIKKQEDGTYEATLVLTDEQTSFLVNFALNLLVQSGLATINEQEVSEDDVSLADQQPLTTETVN